MPCGKQRLTFVSAVNAHHQLEPYHSLELADWNYVQGERYKASTFSIYPPRPAGEGKL